MKIDDLPQVAFHEYAGGVCAQGEQCDFDRCVDPSQPGSALGLLLCATHRDLLEGSRKISAPTRGLRIVK